MPLSRRKFLGALALGAPSFVAHNRARATNTEARLEDAPPSLTNYNAGGRALLVEGKTLLVALGFQSDVLDLTGSLPVKLRPYSMPEQLLTEPQELYFYPVGGRKTFRTILSAPLDAVQGTYTLNIRARMAGGRMSQWTFPYAIEQGDYRLTALTLDMNFSQPPPDIAARMRRDFETDVEIFKRRTPRKWNAPFVRPVPGRDNENFGVKRTVNRTKRYRHIGLDFKASMGTPVVAMNDGTVVLSAEQWTPGETVILDHGGGIFSKYNHLSVRRVRVGDEVKRGQVVALSGRSGGQKTPPHLHLDIIVNRTAVNPEDFMQTAAQLISA